jgi:hypothetical protein
MPQIREHQRTRRVGMQPRPLQFRAQAGGGGNPTLAGNRPPVGPAQRACLFVGWLCVYVRRHLGSRGNRCESKMNRLRGWPRTG